MAVDIVISLIGKIGEFLVEPIGRRFGYLIHYNSSVETLKDQVQILEEVRKDVQGSIDAAKGKGEIIKNEVQNWISRVDGVILEAKIILEDDAVPNKRWFNKWYPDLASRYRLTRESDKKTAEIEKLKGDGKFSNVSKPAASPELVSKSRDFVLFESTRVAIMALMEALVSDEINFIGIHGMGGVGKTTLVKEIARRAKEDNLFDVVVMAVVSQTVEVKNIQQQIADMLGLKLEEKSEQGRAGRLHGILKNVNKILVILDDIWDTLDLAAIGIPFGDDDDHIDPKKNVNRKVRKIVVTTRRRQVCNSMATRIETSKIIHLNALSENESWGLLKMNAGELIDSPELNSVAKEVCRECGGLPIALVTVGRAMRGQDLEEWKEAALELQKSMPFNIEGMDEVVYKCLKLSYDHLKNKEAKSMFLLCCLFPEDYNICIEVLVRYGIGLEMFKDVLTIQEARRRAHSITKNLIDSCLLLAGSETGCIKMHDVVRDVAKTIASDIYFVKAGVKLLEWPNVDTLKHYTGISVMHNQITGCPAAWDCPNLHVLLMQGNCIEQPVPEGVFKGMTALKVFDQSDIFSKGDPYLSRKLDPEFSYLTNLRTLIIKNCRLAAPAAIGKLKMLEVLSLAHCKLLDDLPQEIGELTNIRLVDLEDCQHSRKKFDATFPPNVISRWFRLEELYSSSYLRYTREHVAELKSLSHLTTLVMEIPNFGCIPEGFSFPELEVFKIAIRGSIHHKQPNYLEVCGLVNVRKLLAIPSLGCVQPLLKRTQYLKLSSFKGLRNLFPYLLSDRDGLSALKTLEISDSEEIEYLIHSEEWKMPLLIEQHQDTCLMHLEKLDLQRLGTFKGLCHGALPAEMSLSLQKLKSCKFYKCPKLSNVFASFEMLQRFDELEELSVDSCEALEYVFNLKIEKPVFEEKKLLSHLRELVLCDLPAMKRIWDGPTGLLHLHNLQIADIQNCKKLKVLFDASVAQSLQQLKHLLLKGCDELETVVAKESQRQDGGVTADIVVFPQLVELSLLYLPNLAGFCLDSLPFKWPSFKKLEVRWCPKMKTFAATLDSDGNQSTPKLNQIKLDDVDMILNGRSLNMLIQKYSEASFCKRISRTKKKRLLPRCHSLSCQPFSYSIFPTLLVSPSITCFSDGLPGNCRDASLSRNEGLCYFCGSPWKPQNAKLEGDQISSSS
ncbi:unnamed protein product [Dovyalis caffra]|uniref:AAA+ ATPase domain-containing protein n=1 Tax=Dovyalis caffra TaxID=77055 RepID=A0AAV1SMG2_9ROSI|nr:unnamed protein product [Dovyalis caffra]